MRTWAWRKSLLVCSLVAVAACGGAAPDDLAQALAAPDAGARSIPDAAPAAATPPPIDAQPDRNASLGAPASCVPRDGITDGGSAGRCESSRDCLPGAICCASPNDDGGECSTTACAGSTPRQRCIADCECIVGRCQNAWPYLPYGDCG